MSLLKRIAGSTPTTETDPATTRHGAPPTASRPGSSAVDDNFNEIKLRVQNRLINELDPKMDLSNKGKVRKQVEETFQSILDGESIVLTRNERQRMFASIEADIVGLGPLEQFLADEAVSEIMVNGPKQIYVEKKGRLIKTDATFGSDEHVLRIIDRIVAPLGRRIDELSPMVDARLPDGSRVNAVIRPLALNGPTVTIRKFRKDKLSMNDLVRFGSMSNEMADFLGAAVAARTNIVVSGGTGSGKTTLLNVLSNFIPEDERIITVENAAELQLQQDHVVSLESRPPNVEGRGEISIRDLVMNCLRMRPERIIVGECRGGETMDMLQAMNTRRDQSDRDDVPDGRAGSAIARHSRAGGLGGAALCAAVAPERRHTQGDADHRGVGHGGRCGGAPGHFCLRADRHRREGQDHRAAAAHGRAPQVYREIRVA